MNRTQLLNYLLHQRNGSHYLEIGMHAEDHNFAHIRCEHKTFISDPDYDDFFEKTTDQFDCIFIDGLHTEERTLQDFGHALQHLKPGGCIVLHDCMPPDAWHQREPELYKAGENWNGTAWKAALRIFNSSTWACTLLDMDWGCAVIDSSKNQEPADQPLPDNLQYEIHYPILQKYTASPTNYIRGQIKLFYHLACMGNWQQVFKEQMQQLHHNGFNSAELTVLGTDEDLRHALSIVEECSIEPHVLFQAPDLNHFETPALLAIEKYAKEHNGYVLYLHSKGVSNPADTTKTKWRRLMMQELVVNWERCMQLLPDNDIIGVNWRHMPPTSHFCGNFWYASTLYLRKLEDFKRYYDNPKYKIGDSINHKRLGCEFWISATTEKPKLVSLCFNNVDFCNMEFWRRR